jgi:hypothetical protein
VKVSRQYSALFLNPFGVFDFRIGPWFDLRPLEVEATDGATAIPLRES